MTVNVLALDTSSEWCSVALYCQGQITQQLEYTPQRHGEQLLTMMDTLLTAAHLRLTDLDAIAYGRGPGSFTGIRIAAAVAQGSAFAAQLPLIGISTLAALAHAAWRQYHQQWILAAIDARIGEIYWAAFDVSAIGCVTPLTNEQVGAPNTLAVPVISAGAQWYGAGSGWAAYGDVLQTHTGLMTAQINSTALCTAHDIALLAVQAWQAGAIELPANSTPHYVRERVALKTNERG